MKGPSLYKNSPLKNDEVVDSVKSKQNLATRPLTDNEKKKLKGNVGSAPNPAKTAANIYKGVTKFAKKYLT
mgnify:CR=1 FL=1